MEKNNLNVEITLNKDSRVYNEFNNKQLSNELSNYIYTQCKGFPTKSNIKLKINHNFKIDEASKQKLIDAIRENYGVDIRENLIKINYEHAKELLMFIIGTILLVFSSIFNSFISQIIGEIISIFGCVVIWEIAYNIFFTEVKIRMTNSRLKKLTQAKIEFNEIKEEENLI